MGVSVSASTAIIVAGLFFAFTAFYPVASNGFDRVTDAERDVNERALERQNTALSDVTAEYNETDDALVVNATNDGATGLAVSDVTVVVDNQYVALADEANVTTSVEGNEDTDLWLSGERLSVTVLDGAVDGDLADAERVVVVTEPGVRDATDVEVA